MFKGIFQGLIDLIYPKICLVCRTKLKSTGSVDNLVCPECWSKIKRNAPPFCSSCGRHLEKPLRNICTSCIKKPLHFDRAVSPCIYEGAIKDLIHEFKYRNKDYLGVTLSRLILDFIDEYNLKMDFFDFFIPIPLHRARLREREFNQADILAKQIALKLNKVLLPDALLRRRNNRSQTNLEDKERFNNVKEIFSINKNVLIKGKNILLIDDVLTSGATCSEAARTLKNAGANIVFALTLAN